ncbi:MAG: hypothetical protein QM770_18210 [Tepidisphaeraceae bacterium]
MKAKFVDQADRIPPFQKDGKEAYGMYVYSCDGGKTESLAYIWKYTKEVAARRVEMQKKLEEARKSGKPLPPDAMMMGGEGFDQDVIVFGQNQNKWISGANAMTARSSIKFPCDGDNLIFMPQ